jgi:hypothetical protein
MAIYVLKEYLEEYSGNLMILAGVLLLVVGLMFLETFGSVLSAVTLFLGVILVSFGLFVRLGLFHLKLRSLNGLGTILLCGSVVFFALCIPVMEFLAVQRVIAVPQYFHGIIIGYSEVIITYRPYAWLGAISIWVGVGLFLASLIVKVYCVLK